MISVKTFAYAASAFVLGAGMLCIAPAQTSSSMAGSSRTKSKTSTSDKTFIKKAAEGGIAEVQLGKLAAEKATNPDVKQFGQRMVDDHAKANDQLKQVAEKDDVRLPDHPSAAELAQKDRLEKLSGAQFDKAYMADMLKDHRQDVAEFRTEAKSAHDPDLKSFVEQTLPTLEDHLKTAESVAPKVEGSQRSAAQQPRMPK